MIQLAPTIDMALIGLPGILLGMLLGYVFGGLETLRTWERLALGFISSVIGGIIISLILTSLEIEIRTFETLFIILSFLGGYILGVFSNWAPTRKPRKPRHIIYEPEEDDEEFDRQIEEALGSHE